MPCTLLLAIDAAPITDTSKISKRCAHVSNGGQRRSLGEPREREQGEDKCREKTEMGGSDGYFTRPIA